MAAFARFDMVLPRNVHRLPARFRLPPAPYTPQTPCGLITIYTYSSISRGRKWVGFSKRERLPPGPDIRGKKTSRSLQISHENFLSRSAKYYVFLKRTPRRRRNTITLYRTRSRRFAFIFFIYYYFFFFYFFITRTPLERYVSASCVRRLIFEGRERSDRKTRRRGAAKPPLIARDGGR